MRRPCAYAGSALAAFVLFVFAIGTLLPQSVDVSASAMIDASRAEIWGAGSSSGAGPGWSRFTIVSIRRTLRDVVIARRGPPSFDPDTRDPDFTITQEFPVCTGILCL